MGSVWLKLLSLATKIFTYYLILASIISIGLYKFVKGFFSLLDRSVKSPYRFKESSLNLLYFLDGKLSDGLVKFIGFATPRSEFFTIFFYLTLSVPLSVLKILFYLTFFLLRALSFFPWFLKVALFAILIPPLVYGSKFCSFVLYYIEIFYYLALGLFYKTLKIFIRARLALLELNLLRRHIKDNGRRLNVTEMARVISNINKRFHFEQFGNISASSVSNYYSNSGTFDLDKYFLGPIPFGVYVAGRHAHEHNKFRTDHGLIHDARFFYQPLKKRKLVRFNYPIKRPTPTVPEDSVYNTVRVFEYHRYISMGLVGNFNLSSFPEYYRSKLFSRLLRFNLIPAVNFYYNMFNSTLRNKSKNPDFWANYRKMVNDPARGLTWFEYSRNLLLKDPVFSYNSYDYTSPYFGRKLASRLATRKRYREFAISEGSRFSSDDYRSSTDVSGKPFAGGHFTQFVDDYDHYLKGKVYYKSKMERFWFKRVLLPDPGLAPDQQPDLPVLFPGERTSSAYGTSFSLFFKIVFASLSGAVVSLAGLLVTTVLTLYKFVLVFVHQLKQLVGDFLFRVYLFSVFFILRLPALAARGKQILTPVYEFFTYPVKVSPFSVFWSVTVFSISLSRALRSVSGRFFLRARNLAWRVYNFLILPTDFIKFLFICWRDGTLESLLAYEMDAMFKEMDSFVEWFLNDLDK